MTIEKPRMSRGFDLSKPDELTQEEIDANHAFYTEGLGDAHLGLDFWMENGIGYLKRYRLFTVTGSPQQDSILEKGLVRPNSFGYMILYGMIGYDHGVQYLTRLAQRRATKAQVLEGIGISFLFLGPAGMETVARALQDFEWAPDSPEAPPAPTAAELDKLRSGLDFTKEDMSKDELALLNAWYERTIGEIPPYVKFLGRHRPNMLKAWRNRWENVVHVLPIVSVPLTILHYDVMRGFPDGIRENTLLAKAFGASKESTLSILANASLYTGASGMSIVERAAGDVFDAWED